MQVYENECYNIEDEANSCYLHPDETFVGVCPLCLNERLIILASNLSKHHCLHRRSFDKSLFSCGHLNRQKPALLKIFSLGSGIFHRLELRHHHQSGDSHGPADDDVHDESVSTSSSQQESYISIKIEENGLASWEKNSTSNQIHKVTEVADNNTQEKRKKSVSELEHPIPIPTPIPKPAPKPTTKRLTSWHNRACQLIKKKGSMRNWVCHVSIEKVVEGVEIRKGGWIKRTLTKRRYPKIE
uniref:Uncharacterized protein n=1 Tax=Kalanchoe fedtschenkoi TaxID=63787 RepID=A0A7N0TQX8_KALFE